LSKRRAFPAEPTKLGRRRHWVETGGWWRARDRSSGCNADRHSATPVGVAIPCMQPRHILLETGRPSRRSQSVAECFSRQVTTTCHQPYNSTWRVAPAALCRAANCYTMLHYIAHY